MKSYNFIPGDPIWICFSSLIDDEPIEARVVASTKDTFDVEYVNSAKANRLGLLKRLTRPFPRMEMRDESIGHAKLDELTHWNKVNITESIKKGFGSGHVYFKLGAVTLAVNPNTDQPKQGDSHLKEDGMSLDPLAAELLATIKEENASLLVSGESGSGKSFSINRIISLLTSGVPSLQSKIQASNVLYDAFTNASTRNNVNSSRCAKMITLFCDSKTQMITRADITAHVLELSRVTHRPQQDGNFHILHLLARDSSHAHTRWELVTDLADNNRELSHLGLNLETVKSTLELVVGPAACTRIFQLLSAILHLGSIRFDDKEKRRLHRDSLSAAEAASRLLGNVSCEDLVKVLTVHEIMAGKERIRKVRTAKEASVLRDSLAKLVYGLVFEYLNKAINEYIWGECSLAPAGSTRKIHLVDIFGFENFPNNGLDQLFINHVNESFHEIYTDLVTSSAPLNDTSNVSLTRVQDCTRLLDGKPGILSCLTDACKMKDCSDITLGRMLQDKVSESTGSAKFADEWFSLPHYAGNVAYKIDGMIKANHNAIPEALMAILASTNDPILFSSTKAKMLTEIYRNSLREMLSITNDSRVLLLRTIRSNRKNLAWSIDPPTLVEQLGPLGIEAAIGMKDAQFRYIYDFSDFVNKFDAIAGQSASQVSADKAAVQGILSKAKVKEGCSVTESKVLLTNAAMAALQSSQHHQVNKPSPPRASPSHPAVALTVSPIDGYLKEMPKTNMRHLGPPPPPPPPPPPSGLFAREASNEVVGNSPYSDKPAKGSGHDTALSNSSTEVQPSNNELQSIFSTLSQRDQMVPLSTSFLHFLMSDNLDAAEKRMVLQELDLTLVRNSQHEKSLPAVLQTNLVIVQACLIMAELVDSMPMVGVVYEGLIARRS